MSLVRFRDENGKLVEIIALKGEKGDPGGVGFEDYATKDKGGTVRIDSYYGIANTGRGDGKLWLFCASNAEIDEKKHYFKPIVPANLEYAVRSVGDGCYASIDTIGDIETAVDAILAIQEELIGGDV